jgi:DNA helicase-2/ATP-dependent DNA helicase PcrA
VTSLEHSQIVADEAALEKQYSKSLAERARAVQVSRQQSVSNRWTTGTGVDMPTAGSLIGRVALAGPDHDFLEGRRDFYIGSTHHTGDDYEVFSWVAPIACTFYRKSSEHHLLCDRVAAVRVFAHRVGSISDFEDDSVSGANPQSLFERRRLVVPKAPATPLPDAPLPVEEKVADPPDPREDARPAHDDREPPHHAGESVAARPKPSTTAEPELRAPDLLRRQLAKPKTVAMSAVLSTLQSDQYEAITRPVSESQVLQGHPGTGKTIIAAHRAAYFLNAETPESARPRGKVLILGPTVEYVKHVQSALRELIDDASSYEVQSLPALLDSLAGLPESAVPTESVRLQNVSEELARLVDQALKRTKSNIDGESPTAEDVYAELLWLRDDPPDEGLQREWWDYLNTLPSTLGELRKKKSREFLGLLAYIGVRTTATPDPGHVIVDEAQDIHPIEWEILGRLGNVGGWTILGDLNQRRTDHTFGSWDSVAKLLAIENENGEAPLRVLENGYRSTSQIIRFANQLLPARDRKLFSLQQDGEHPVVRREASAKKLYSSALAEAQSLLDEIQTGTVAIISVNAQEIRSLLRSDDWQSEVGNPFVWSKNGRELRMLPPERARGLEFDAVVVVEPSDFPENLGRQGVLYTALTRANRFLSVVYHRALPRGLKAHA